MKIQAVAVVVDTSRATFYKPDGSTFVMEQGHPELARILGEITPGLARREVVEFTTDPTPAANLNDVFNTFEQNSGGVVKFFRIAKKKLKNILGIMDEPEAVDNPYVAPQTVGQVPQEPNPIIGDKYGEGFVAESSGSITAKDCTVTNLPEVTPAIEPKKEVLAHEVKAPSVAKAQAAVASIMANATVGRKDVILHNDHKDDDEDTVVAVVETPKGPAIIQGAEALKGQVKNSVANRDYKGMQKFLERVASVAKDRRHSAEELMKFMARGDLPVADDGSIIIFKILKKKPNVVEGVTFDYVDCHSKRVHQKIGTYVNMPINLVDPNRRNECSNGLHVARRSYLGHFSGDVCVLAKVRPEDVIAVPEYDSNKMRVRGYHILFELTNEEFEVLKKDVNFNGSETAKAMLGKAMAGDHVGVLYDVEITEGYGGGLKTKILANAARVRDELQSNVIQKADRKSAAIEDLGDDKSKSAPAIDPKALAKTVAVVKGSKATQAGDLYREFQNATDNAVKRIAAESLLALKKQAKKSWQDLGFSAGFDGSELNNFLKGNVANQGHSLKEAEVAVTQAVTPREKILALLARPGNMDRLLARQIVSIKRGAKKGWSALGVTDEALIARMEKLAKD